MRKALGRGLGALISAESQQQKKTKEREYVTHVNIDKVKPNRYQPRTGFDKKKLEELMASIKEKGVVQPILIRPSGDEYELIAGERRLRAAKSLGYSEIPAVVKNVDDLNALELSLIENIQREELNPIEEALAYKRLIDEFNFTQEAVGQAVGKDRATVANNLRLLALPKKIQEFLSKSLMSTGHAKVLLSVGDTGLQIEFSKKVLAKDLSVRALESLIKRSGTSRKKTVTTDTNMREIEERIQERLGTKVRITRRKKRGTIQIEYYSDEDLSRILKAIGCR